MTHGFRRETAKIYQFPVKARAASGTARDDGQAGAEMRSRSVVATSAGSAWYHEAAVQEAERPRKP
ncbi:DUF2735 domain-containing protein [Methylobacterium nigriterrae]|uniref:DUF2735 domain-containing protein n=1 Tax=Methylobacterium nigriterrae TaxID=3127512 RepID=UPI003013BE71